MSSITIRNLDPAIKERLRLRAAQHGHSMEAEARRILQATLKEPPKRLVRSLYDRIHDRFAAIGDVDLELPRLTGQDLDIARVIHGATEWPRKPGELSLSLASQRPQATDAVSSTPRL